MSSTPLLFGTGLVSYNFKNDIGKAFGNQALIELDDGVYAMRGGDGDQNQAVTAFDFLNVWLPNNGSAPGYLQSDFNLDGQTTAFDFIQVWLPSNGSVSQVPASN